MVSRTKAPLVAGRVPSSPRVRLRGRHLALCPVGDSKPLLTKPSGRRAARGSLVRSALLARRSNFPPTPSASKRKLTGANSSAHGLSRQGQPSLQIRCDAAGGWLTTAEGACLRIVTAPSEWETAEQAQPPPPSPPLSRLLNTLWRSLLFATLLAPHSARQQDCEGWGGHLFSPPSTTDMKAAVSRYCQPPPRQQKKGDV